MPHPCPHHCPKGGGGGAVVLVLVAVALIAAVARPVMHAAEVIAEVALIVAASVVGLAVIAGVAYAAARLHRRQARRRQSIPGHAPAVQALSGPQRAAIEPTAVYRPGSEHTGGKTRARSRP